MKILPSLDEALAALEQRAHRHASLDFADRVALLDDLELHVLDRLQGLAEAGPLDPQLRALEERARALYAGLEAANARFLAILRGRVRSGRYSPGGLRRAFERVAIEDAQGVYTALDLLFAGLLAQGAPGQAQAPLHPDMVYYQPTPAQKVLDLLQRSELGPADVFCDLGSGLGQVAILAALLTGAQAGGVEHEPAYVAHARACAQALQLPHVSFAQGDARETRLGGASVYFLYTPFRGAMLRQVLQRLRHEAAQRPLRVATFGPCTAEVAEQRWLRLLAGTLADDEVAVFQSV